MLTGNLGGFYSSDDSTSYGAQYRWGVHVSPGVFYFLRDRIGLGAFVSESHRRSDAYRAARENEIGGGLRMLFDLPLSQNLSLFVWPWLSYQYAWRYDELGADELSSRIFENVQEIRFLQLGLFLPLVFRPNEHFGFGLGPYVNVDFLMRRSLEFTGGSYGAGAQQRGQWAQDNLDGQPSHRILTGVMSSLMGSF